MASVSASIAVDQIVALLANRYNRLRLLSEVIASHLEKSTLLSP